MSLILCHSTIGTGEPDNKVAYPEDIETAHAYVEDVHRDLFDYGAMIWKHWDDGLRATYIDEENSDNDFESGIRIFQAPDKYPYGIITVSIEDEEEMDIDAIWCKDYKTAKNYIDKTAKRLTRFRVVKEPDHIEEEDPEFWLSLKDAFVYSNVDTDQVTSRFIQMYMIETTSPDPEPVKDKGTNSFLA